MVGESCLVILFYFMYKSISISRMKKIYKVLGNDWYNYFYGKYICN